MKNKKAKEDALNHYLKMKKLFVKNVFVLFVSFICAAAFCCILLLLSEENKTAAMLLECIQVVLNGVSNLDKKKILFV